MSLAACPSQYARECGNVGPKPSQRKSKFVRPVQHVSFSQPCGIVEYKKFSSIGS